MTSHIYEGRPDASAMRIDESERYCYSSLLTYDVSLISAQGQNALMSSEPETNSPSETPSEGTASETTTNPMVATADSALNQHRHGPYADVDLTEISVTDLEELVAFYKDYLKGAGRESSDLAWPVCITLIVAPHEMSVREARPKLCAITEQILSAAPDGSLPEADVCRLWLKNTAEGSLPSADDAENFYTLARGPLWRPVQSLAYRALAYFGLRTELAAILPPSGPLSLYQADAWMEASHPRGVNYDCTARIATEPAELPAADFEHWKVLLDAEAALAGRDGPNPNIEAPLSSLIGLPFEEHPRTFAESVRKRLVARATAAFARCRIAQLTGDDGLLASKCGDLLPDWERQYLHGDVYWILGDLRSAENSLIHAFELNPHQSSLRLAMAALPRRQDLGSMLHLLDVPNPSEQVQTAKTALLCRLENYEEVGRAIERMDADPKLPAETARCSWGRGRRQARAQHNMLKTSLAEKNRDWKKAAAAWSAACDGLNQEMLFKSRQLFAAASEIKSIPPHHARRRADLERVRGRLEFETARHPVHGTAGFFRGAACVETNPEQARRTLTALLNRRKWIQNECRVGGQRVHFLADSLVKLGALNEAREAYRLAAEAGQAGAGTMHAILSLITEPGGAPEKLNIEGSASDSPWSWFLPALALLTSGDVAAARTTLQESTQHGLPAPMARCGAALCDFASGTAASIAESDLAALPISAQAKTLMRLLLGDGSNEPNVVDFLNGGDDGWLTASGIDRSQLIGLCADALCSRGKYDEARDLLEEIPPAKSPRLAALRVLLETRHALHEALSGDAARLEKALASLETNAEAPA